MRENCPPNTEGTTKEEREGRKGMGEKKGDAKGPVTLLTVNVGLRLQLEYCLLLQNRKERIERRLMFLSLKLVVRGRFLTEIPIEM